ncbi:MAG: ATP-binding protein [Actinomycetota bacterium]
MIEAESSAHAAVIERDLRSVAQLKMLHSLAPRLNRLNDVKEIGEAITAELKTLIDYHNCRVYLLADDNYTLVPIAFRGELLEYEGETYEELLTHVGEGITGHAAATRVSFYTPNAEQVPFAVHIEGTPVVDESMLAVPMLYGDRVIGVIVLSKLGIDLFDEEEDTRVLEVLASHAAVAFENARLFQSQREAAETSSALLGLSQALTGVNDIHAVLKEAVDAIPSMLRGSATAAYQRDPDSGILRLVHQQGLDPTRLHDPDSRLDVEPDMAARFLISVQEPFILTKDVVATVPPEYHLADEICDVLVAPLRWEPDGFGAIVVLAPDAGSSFSDTDLQLARGIADITSLALGNARRFHEQGRFHELVESLEAIFWEADAASLHFSFLSRRATQILGPAVQQWMVEPRTWGDHVHPSDQEQALATFRAAIAAGGDHSLEYRAVGWEGQAIWLRDQVHVVRDAKGGTRLLRGLMVDITERKLAEQALRNSEQTYSEAFRREREATQQLRSLDEMKNTFLEAVSHDLRTPLTSILGSALTLEQNGRNLPPEDSLDLVQRIAANARKLERLLSDLLDLDRLQRGIVSPQRRPTDVGALLRQAIEESELLGDRRVEVETDSVVASIDAAKVERIVENLLANAARHTPPGTRLWVRSGRNGGGVLIVVEDEGPGVPSGMREAIFEPFRQVPGSSSHSPGVGVGLSLVGRFAELHGGRAWVEDRPGGGASFRVFLPDA